MANNTISFNFSKQALKNLFQPDLVLWHYLIIFLAIFFAFYFGMGTYPLENMNEGLYAEIPREMLNSGSYIIPHLNYVPYLEKPPLLYWLIVLAYKIFGVLAFSARLIPAVSATIVCISLLFFAKTLNRAKAGWLAALILASSVGFILIARVLIFDMLLTALFTLSLLFFYQWYERSSRFCLRLCYLCIGLTFMTKGLLAFALIPGIALIFLLTEPNPWQKILAALDLPGILLLLLTVVPWIILATMRQPNFFYDFFINEQVLRFLNKRVPMDYHTGPIYFYLPRIIGCLLPWSLFFPLLFTKNTDQTLKSLIKFLWLWFGLVLLFFSLSQAKGDYYMIVGVPPLALLLGLKLERFYATDRNKLLISITAILLISAFTIITLLFLATFMSSISQHLIQFKLPANWDKAISTAWLFIVIYGLCAGLLLRYAATPTILFTILAGLMLPIVMLYLANKQGMQAQRSAASIAHYVQAHDAQRQIYLFRDYEKISSISFYLQRRLPIIDSQSNDLYFGSKTPQAAGWFISSKDFMQQARQQALYVVMDKDNFQTFKQRMQPLNFCKVFYTANTLLVSNNPYEC